MKVVKFKGGLGNQMFQYAFLILLKEKLPNEIVKADFTYYKSTTEDIIRQPRLLQMNVNFDICTNEELDSVLKLSHTGASRGTVYKGKLVAEKLLNRKYYFEVDRRPRNIDRIIKYDYFDGYWQAWKYLSDIEVRLKQHFTLKQELSTISKERTDRYSKRNSVFVGIRRGDYLSNKKMIKHYGDTDIAYYQRAMQYVCEKLENPLFVFFSNDIEWVKENLSLEKMQLNKEAEIEYSEEIVSDLEELFVMSSCRNAIISNSTFNFWGAWLIENKDKIVVAPEHWFKDGKTIDIVPDSWIKM